MTYLLDTNTWIHYLKRPGSPIEARLRATPEVRVAVCWVVRSVYRVGARKYGDRAGREARIAQTLAPFRSFPFDDRHYAIIRDQLETQGELIGGNDLLIAAITLSNNVTLVTNDHAFRRVAGLIVEDWSLEDKPQTKQP
jgi:tRNA(fMet)-specific endonuclease VapC